MTRELRARRYDSGPEAITRPDIVPAAASFAEDSVSSASFEPRAVRELAPYPALRPLTDESTVVYASLQPVSPGAAVSAGAAFDSEERSPSSAPTERRTGTRRRLVSTVPPPSRTRLKVGPAANDQARATERRRPAHISTGASAAPGAAPTKGTGFLLGAVLVTAIAAAALGSALGNGSLERAVELLHGRMMGPAPVLAPLVPSTPVRPRVVAAAPSPRPVTAAPTAVGVPILSFQDLPPAQADAPVAERKRPVGTHRR